MYFTLRVPPTSIFILSEVEVTAYGLTSITFFPLHQSTFSHLGNEAEKEGFRADQLFFTENAKDRESSRSYNFKNLALRI